MLPGAHAKVNTIIELEKHTQIVPNDLFGDYRLPGWELRCFNDGIVFSAERTPERPKRERTGDRGWFEFRMGGWNFGVDVRRPGTWRRYNGPKPVKPWDPTIDGNDLELALWSVRDEAAQLARLLERKPESVDLQEAINSA